MNCRQLVIVWLIVLSATTAARAEPITVRQADDHLIVETDALEARINTRGYVSGVARQGLLDKKTGARDQGFGLHIMDFLLAPGKRDDGYMEVKHHGQIEKHYVEGPQICTQARELKPEIVQGPNFAAVRFRYTFNKPYPGYQAGSTWEQTLVFQPGLRYFLSAERITSANDVDDLFYRIDMPGHIKHKAGDSFSRIWLSYLEPIREPSGTGSFCGALGAKCACPPLHGRFSDRLLGEIPSTEFESDFAPDERFLYQRTPGKLPERMIRAYQVKLEGKPGPWLAGMTLDPAEVSEAWCHQRGYVCFIEELHGKPVKKGESFGAAYIVGWFDDIPQMEATYDRYKGRTRIVLEREAFRLE